MAVSHLSCLGGFQAPIEYQVSFNFWPLRLEVYLSLNFGVKIFYQLFRIIVHLNMIMYEI